MDNQEHDIPPQEPILQPVSGASDVVLSFIWETIKIVAISLVIILPIRYYLVQPFFVQGQSMEPNFQNHDYILVDKLSYRVDAPKRGDVVVFRYPKDPSQYFIKRIIGLPGDIVQIRDNTIRIFNDEFTDGLLLEENIYLPETNPTAGTYRVTVPDGEFFVMGDNREHSSDSRFWGTVAKKFLAGRGWLRLWPLNNINFVPRVKYPIPAIE